MVHTSFGSEASAEVYVLADNRLTEMGGWNETKLANVFKELREQNVPLTGSGFSKGAVRRFMRMADPSKRAGKTPKDKLGGFLEAETKQVVLYFTAAGYDAFIDKLDKLMADMGLDSNSAVIEQLVARAVMALSEEE